MNRSDDFQRFFEDLADMAALYRQTVTEKQAAMYFNDCAEWPLEVVQAAWRNHRKNPDKGIFLPMPSDVAAFVQSMQVADGRPGVEEAWAMAWSAMDERLTAVLTTEIIGAMAIAMPLMRSDKVAGRKAFQEAYQRMVTEARAQMRPVTWKVQLGDDREHRVAAISEGVRRGRLQHDDVAHLLPDPGIDLVVLVQQRGAPILLAAPKEPETDAEKAELEAAKAANEARRQEAVAFLDKLRGFLQGDSGFAAEVEAVNRIRTERENARRAELWRQVDALQLQEVQRC